MIELLWNPAHLHVIMNHVPTVGFGLGLLLFIIALISRSHDLERASLGIFFVVALVSIAVYVTGNAAEGVLRGADATPAYPPGVYSQSIRAHEDAALLAFVFIELTGFFSWLALWQWRQRPTLPSWNLPAVLMLGLVAFAFVARAAEIGGNIRHTEILTEADAAALKALPPETEGVSKTVSGTGVARDIGLFITTRTWVWPALETLHFIGLSMLFTVVLILDLRLLGVARRIPYSAVHQLLPIGMLGFAINLITGMLFFVGVPGQYIHNKTFFWKIATLMPAGLNVLYFMFVDETWAVGAGDEAPFPSKVAAVSAIALWAFVLYCGHMLPFIGNAF